MLGCPAASPSRRPSVQRRCRGSRQRAAGPAATLAPRIRIAAPMSGGTYEFVAALGSHGEAGPGSPTPPPYDCSHRHKLSRMLPASSRRRGLAALKKESFRYLIAGFAMSAPDSPRQNDLLAALPEASYQRLLPNLELVPMRLGEVLYTSGSELPHVYFPTTCIVSLVYVMANGASAEIAVTGREGLLGVSLLLGGETTPNQAVVQSARPCI